MDDMQICLVQCRFRIELRTHRTFSLNVSGPRGNVDRTFALVIWSQWLLRDKKGMGELNKVTSMYS